MDNQEMNHKEEEIKFENRIPLEGLKESVTNLKDQLSKVIVGQENFVELLIVGLII